MAKLCIFCGAEPVTNEHLWPKWLRPFLGGATKHLYRHGSIGGDNPSVAEWEAPAATKKRALLCRDCNMVWGANLQGASKDILLRMILGEGESQLSDADQAQVALWAVKTAMVFDRSYSDERAFIPNEHLRFLREQNQPPPETVVWLAGYGLKNRVATHVSFPFPFFGPERDTRERPARQGYGVTLSIGHLVLQMLCNPGSEERALEVLREISDFTVQIWPTSGTALWPPLYAVDDDGLDALSFPFTTPPPRPT